MTILRKIFDSPISYYSFVFALASAYFWGVVSWQHFFPSAQDAYIALLVVLLTSCGLLIFFSCNKIRQISYTTILWFCFFLLLLVQPVINDLAYPDSSFLTTIPVLVCALVSLVIAQCTESQKAKAVLVIAYTVLVCGFFTVFSQLVQLFRVEWLLGSVVFDAPPSGRLVGNIAQVNQAAFVSSLAMASIIYLVYHHHLTKFRIALFMFIMLWLSVGIGLCASRGGVLLAIAALLSGSIFYKASLKKRLVMGGAFFPVLIIGYIIGTELMNYFMEIDFSAVGRINGGILDLRIQQFKDAWFAFTTSPIKGIGWRELMHFGLQNASEMHWFTTANHAHNVVAQIGAELGILGLLIFLGFVIVLLKKLRFSLSPYRAFSFAILMLTAMYSLSEFPLWITRFLLLATFFVAVLDNGLISLNFNSKLLPSFLATVLICGSVFYIVQYKKYLLAYYYITWNHPDLTYEAKLDNYRQVPKVFGFSQYKELMLFQLNPIKTENLEGQIALGNRVLSMYLSDSLILKQANLLMVAKREKEADKMYKSGCLFNRGERCSDVISSLRANAIGDPELYGGYYERFAEWYNANFDDKLDKL